MSTDDPGRSPSARWALIRTLAITGVAALSLYFTRLALPAVFLTLIGFASLPKSDDKARRWARAALLVAALAAGVGTLRFVATQAVPGIIQGGENAAAAGAVSNLRELLFAEDAMRRYAFIDPDHDKVGSAGLLVELTSQAGLRGADRLDPPILNRRFTNRVETRIGPAAAVSGYLFVVCLPAAQGGFSARPADAIDDEAAERRFVAYAWPAATGQGLSEAYFLDEHENILVHDNRDAHELRWAGPNFPPPCDAAVSANTANEWRAWRGKKPRVGLPGE